MKTKTRKSGTTVAKSVRRSIETQRIVETVSFLECTARKTRFAVPAHSIQGVQRSSTWIPLPGISTLVAGIVQWKEQWITVIHPVGAADEAEPSEISSSHFVVLQHEGVYLACLVESVGVFTQASIEPVSGQRRRSVSEYLLSKGIIHAGNETIPVLDIERLFQAKYITPHVVAEEVVSRKGESYV